MKRPMIGQTYKDWTEVDSERYEYFHALDRVTIAYTDGTEDEFWLDSLSKDSLKRQLEKDLPETDFDTQPSPVLSFDAHELLEGELWVLSPAYTQSIKKSLVKRVRFADTADTTKYYGIWLDHQTGYWMVGTAL